MPLAITPEEIAAPPSVLRRKPWTRLDYEAVERTGAFEGLRYELIEGELIDKMGMNEPHAVFLQRLYVWLMRTFGGERVRIQMPVDVAPEDNPTSEPQPDAAVTFAPSSDPPFRRPGPWDLALIVEVADTTVAFDTSTKAGLYARAGIQEYWVLDVAGRRLFVHRQPERGACQSLTVYSRTEPVTPLAAPSASLVLADLGI